MSGRASPRPSQQGRLALSTAAERARDEETALLRRYKAYQRQRNAELLAGPHGADIRILVTFLRGMGQASGRELVARVADAVWLRTADDETRQAVLRIIGAAITRAREKAGLAPFDDPFPDQPQNAFQQIRDMLRTRSETTSFTIAERARVEA